MKQNEGKGLKVQSVGNLRATATAPAKSEMPNQSFCKRGNKKQMIWEPPKNSTWHLQTHSGCFHCTIIPVAMATQQRP